MAQSTANIGGQGRLLRTLAAATFASCIGGSATSETVDVMHFWTAESESAALNAFRGDFEASGGTWFEDSYPTEREMREAFFDRVRDGFPPSAVQWLVSDTMQDMLRSGVIRPVDNVVPQSVLDRVRPLALAALEVDGVSAGVPVGFHGYNWAYYNAGIMKEFGFAAPRSWDEFFTQMETIQAEGRPTIAIGSGTWQLGVVFDALLADSGGEELVTAIRIGAIETHRAAMIEAFDGLIRYADLIATSGVEVEMWNDATRAVAEDRATVQIMGDWAKGELVALGYTPGEDFLCHITPGRNDSYLATVDLFLLPTTEDAAETQAQGRFVETLLDPENQAAFSLLKGALPVVGDVDPSRLDVCGRQGMVALASDDGRAFLVPNGSNPAVGSAIGTLMDLIRAQKITDGTAAYEELSMQVDIALGN